MTGAIDVNGSPQAISLAAGDSAQITFSGAAGANLGLSFGPVTGPTRTARVLRPDGTTLPGSSVTVSTSGASLDLSLSVSGTYTIVLDAASSSSGTVTLTLSDDLEVSITDNTNGPSVVLTPRSGQNIRLRFNGTAQEHLGLGLTSSNLNLGSCPNFCTVKLLNSTGGQVGSGGYIGSQYNDYNVPTIPSTGSYTLFLDLGAQTNMSFTVTLLDDIVATGALNGASASLTPRPGQNVRFPFIGITHEHLGLGLSSSNLNLTSCANLCSVRLLQPNGTQVGSGGFLGSQYTDYNVPSLPSDSDYTLFVDLGSQTNMSMTLTLTDDAVVAGAANGPSSMLTPRPGQNVRVAFTALASQHLELELVLKNLQLSSCANYCTVKVLDANGAQVGSGGYVGSQYTTYNLPTLPGDGAYTLFFDLGGQENMVFPCFSSSPRTSSHGTNRFFATTSSKRTSQTQSTRSLITIDRAARLAINSSTGS